MGEVRIIVSSNMLMDALHIPKNKNYVIVGGKILSNRQKVFYNGDNKKMIGDIQIELVIQGDEFPPTPYDSEPLLVMPIVHFNPESYFLDWNLPKEEDNESERVSTVF